MQAQRLPITNQLLEPIEPKQAVKIDFVLDTLQLNIKPLLLSERIDSVIFQLAAIQTQKELSIEQQLQYNLYTNWRKSILGEPTQLRKYEALDQYYATNKYLPAWSLGRYLPDRTLAFVQCIGLASEEGLLPSDYHYTEILALIRQFDERIESITPTEIIELDLYLSDALLLLGNHYHNGKIPPKLTNATWNMAQRTYNEADFMLAAMQHEDPCSVLQMQLPKHSGYAYLKNQLKIYNNLNWQQLDLGNTVLQLNDEHEQLPELIRRLKVEGDLPTDTPEGTTFTKAVQTGVMNCEKRLGLNYDGMVTNQTIVALNTSVEMRRKQIIANMERHRWLPDNLGSDYLVINIPAFELLAVENNKFAFNRRVIVGREIFETPLFSDSIRYIVINPYWTLPQSIARNELMFNILNEPNFLANNDYSVFTGGKKIDYNKVDWENANPDDYVFRQGTNAYNPLGRVKFMFPNKHYIYLHDTPFKDLFGNAFRSNSHGCIRVEQPIELAKYLIAKDPASTWTAEDIEKALFLQEETKIDLNQPIPIHMLYFTAYESTNYQQQACLHFRGDLYNWDEELYNQLQKPYKDLIIDLKTAANQTVSAQ